MWGRAATLVGSAHTQRKTVKGNTVVTPAGAGVGLTCCTLTGPPPGANLLLHHAPPREGGYSSLWAGEAVTPVGGKLYNLALRVRTQLCRRSHRCVPCSLLPCLTHTVQLPSHFILSVALLVNSPPTPRRGR